MISLICDLSLSSPKRRRRRRTIHSSFYVHTYNVINEKSIQLIGFVHHSRRTDSTSSITSLSLPPPSLSCACMNDVVDECCPSLFLFSMFTNYWRTRIFFNNIIGLIFYCVGMRFTSPWHEKKMRTPAKKKQTNTINHQTHKDKRNRNTRLGLAMVEFCWQPCKSITFESP